MEIASSGLQIVPAFLDAGERPFAESDVAGNCVFPIAPRFCRHGSS